ncbi:MAG: transcriptional regulator, partial [Rhodococcus sp. (in: high G+C Gram-positive bacteria)]
MSKKKDGSKPRASAPARPKQHPVKQAKPQRIGPPPQQKRPRRKGRRWLAALAVALLVVAGVAVAGYVYLSRNSNESTPEAQIRTSISSFTQALSSGDLQTLRSSSCGDLAAYYRDIPDAEFADVHRAAVEQGNIPVVEEVDAVQI